MVSGDLLGGLSIQELKGYFQITPEDEEVMREVGGQARQWLDPFLERLNSHLAAFPQTHAFFPDRETQMRAQMGQRQHYLRMFSGRYDQDYMEDRTLVGLAHDRVNLPPIWYIGCYALYTEHLLERVSQAFPDLPLPQMMPMFQSLLKFIFLDIALAWEAFYRVREARLKERAEAIEKAHRELQALHRFALEQLERMKEREMALGQEVARYREMVARPGGTA